MTSPSLTCRSISKTFRFGREMLSILQGVDAAFQGGTWTTIQGASGSGKSTLLQILGGLEAPTEGNVLWDDQPIYAWSGSKLANWRNKTIGFVFQAYHLLPELSALENVEFPARLGRKHDPKKSMDLLAQVGLTHRFKHRPNELSGGEQQRVAIARALRNEPVVLLADEPTGNLDAKTGHEIMDLLKGLTEARQLGVIMVTHDDELAKLGSQRLHLSLGKLIP